MAKHPQCFIIAYAFLVAGSSCGPAFAANSAAAGNLIIESPTLHSVGFEWSLSGDDNKNSTVALEYRTVGSSTWQTGLPLVRQDMMNVPSGIPVPYDNHAGSALMLSSGTAYEFRLTLTDADGGSTQRTVQATTRGEPRAYSGGRTLYVVPGSPRTGV